MIETENKVYARRCESHVEALRRAVPGCIEKVEWQCEDQLTITVKQDKLPEAVHYLYYERYGWIPVIIGNDERSLCGRYAVYYVISMEGEDPGWVTVRTEVDPAKMTFPSVTPFVPACVWGERELRDMFGLIPEGLPDRRRLVLPDDWPSGLYPLRKDSMDYRFRPLPRATWKTTSSWPIPRARTTLVPMGPLHITSDEPGHFRLFVEGETIVDADYRLFYVHRGMEKVAETRLNYDAVTFLADRICGICGCAHWWPMPRPSSAPRAFMFRRAPNTSAPSCSRSSVCTRICSILASHRTTRASTPASSSSSASARSPWTWPRSSPVTARPTVSM